MELLKTGMPAKNVMYYTFDLEDRPTDVADIVCMYLDKIADTNSSRQFLFLDEISNVLNWQRAIKNLHDRQRLVGCTVMTTGSHLVDLRRSDELLPGRRGRPNDRLDKFLLPMSFGRYVAVMDPSLSSLVRGGILASANGRVSALRALAEGREFDGLEDLSFQHNKLRLHLDGYLSSGGMPLPVDEFANARQVESKTYKTYLNSIQSIMRSTGKDPQQTDRVAGKIATSVGSTVSWSALGKGVGVSHSTAEEHTKTLCDMMVATTLYRYDSAANLPKFDSNKKIYFRDPFFSHAFKSHVHGSDARVDVFKMLDDAVMKGRMVEQTVADCVMRIAEAMRSPGLDFDPTYSVMYWRSEKSKREVDFVLRDGESLIPVEVKYQNAIRRDDLWGLTDFEKATGRTGGIVVTRQDLKLGDKTLVPAHIFLLLG